MSAEYYLYPIRWKEGEHFIIWFTNDVDGVVLDEQGSIASFSSTESATAFAKRQGIVLVEQLSSVLDLTWISDPIAKTIDCVRTLNAWNCFKDVGSSLNSTISAEFLVLDQTLGDTYEKLFWGNNLPAVTPPGEQYEPEWSEEEIAGIGLILSTGFRLFLNNLPVPYQSPQARLM